MKYFQKFYGQSKNSTKSVDIKEMAFIWMGGLTAIGLIGYLTKSFDVLLVMGSFGASCVLIFAFHTSPFSQPRNIVVGHFLSTLTGLVFLHLLGDAWWSMALALATAMILMLMTKSVHPPAGSNPLIVFLINADYGYLIFPSLSGAVILVIVALLYLNLHPEKAYPQYWF